MTLILKRDPDIVKMYHHTKNEVSMPTDTHTPDTRKALPLPHTREVKMSLCHFFVPKVVHLLLKTANVVSLKTDHVHKILFDKLFQSTSLNGECGDVRLFR